MISVKSVYKLNPLQSSTISPWSMYVVSDLLVKIMIAGLAALKFNFFFLD